jgi:hypothetical protein
MKGEFFMEKPIKYVFYAIEGYGEVEYDITGEELKNLWKICAQYSEYLSFSFMRYHDTIAFEKELEAFRVSDMDVISRCMKHTGYYHWYLRLSVEERAKFLQNELKFYRVCPELLALLSQIAAGIFKFMDGEYPNPEDPTFYRADGSVFLHSIIHEGEVYLCPREDEDVSSILSNPLWQVFKNPYIRE